MIELLVVVAIIGVLASMAATQFPTLMSRTRAKTAIRDLRSALQQVKMEAVKQNTDCLVVFTPVAGSENGSFVACLNTATTNNCMNPGDGIIRQINLNEYKSALLTDNTQFSGSVTGSTRRFIFNSRGVPKTAAGGVCSGTIEVWNEMEPNYFLSLAISASGGMTIQ